MPRIAHHGAQVDVDLLEPLQQEGHGVAALVGRQGAVELAARDVPRQQGHVLEGPRHPHMLAVQRQGRQQGQHASLQAGLPALGPAHQRKQQGHGHHWQQQRRQALGEAGALQLAQLVQQAMVAHAAGVEVGVALGAVVQALVQRAGGAHLVVRGLDAHRHVAHGLAVFHDGRDVGAHPVVAAILAQVLDHARPGAAMADGGPQVLEGIAGHVGVAHDVVRLAHQLVHGIAADMRERGVAVRDAPRAVGGGHQQLGVGHQELFIARHHGLGGRRSAGGRPGSGAWGAGRRRRSGGGNAACGRGRGAFDGGVHVVSLGVSAGRCPQPDVGGWRQTASHAR